MNKPIVAIVGRPNVGKSVLFNRLARQRITVVEDRPGVTRDRVYADTDIYEKDCALVDTGGLDLSEKLGIPSQMAQQAKLAVEEAAVILFVVDAREGLTSVDHAIADLLRKTRKPVLLVANKLDGQRQLPEEIHELRLADPIPISALHGRNMVQLVDAIYQNLPAQDGDSPPEVAGVRIAVVGCPNVGKSALVNSVLGEERVIVSEIAGTTRDAVDTTFAWKDQQITLVDTAGLRKKARVKDSLEYYCVLRSLRAVERADIVFLVLDAGRGVTEQDSKIAGYSHEEGKPIVVVVNKWDLIESRVAVVSEQTTEVPEEQKHTRPSSRSAPTDRPAQNDFLRAIRDQLIFLDYSPVVFVSALKKTGLNEMLTTGLKCLKNSQRRVSTGELNSWLNRLLAYQPPPSSKGKQVKFYYVSQVSVSPPSFAIFVNDPELVHFSYLRNLENRLRESFGFDGTPLRLWLRKRQRKASDDGG